MLLQSLYYYKVYKVNNQVVVLHLCIKTWRFGRMFCNLRTVKVKVKVFPAPAPGSPGPTTSGKEVGESRLRNPKTHNAQ